ncbi:UDP-N-acetylmuramate dehydrogenase [Fuchsiella alkaliacetigena]|uniref:UDP-N-acetylmuramate dehydrogenase n=1 Tax=Fuchsiella alkaliacetigena TaxID=957042 RepID=UPI00200B9FA3|nr:UDP-N-acetylmuramate dehydrogenase [Fuchsiella alkaliacetigena]MCK8823671.1 UDP-N-acetylmuramate dehydrogenase [Fuchsiella alkaliacetigena]
MEQKIKSELEAKLKGELSFEESLAKHTYFRIGGPATVLIIPADIEDLQKTLSYLHSNGLEYRVLGNGSNLLVADEGFAGVVIKLAGSLNEIEIDGSTVRAGAGARLPVVARRAAKAGLAGLEFGVGIPATVGGATVMNAGLGASASVGGLINRVEVLSATGAKQSFEQANCEFAYRSSRFQEGSSVIVEVEFGLTVGDSQNIEAKMKELINSRRQSQPLSLPNAGCIFKNPEGDSAGRLIDEAGAKGLQIGGAKVSEKHANFIVNDGGARARDVLELIDKVRSLVNRKYGILLELEIEFWPSRR